MLVYISDTGTAMTKCSVHLCVLVVELHPLIKTLPRLELLGCLVTAQLLSSVIKALNLPTVETEYTCWSNSMVALGWIRSNPSRVMMVDDG